MLDILKYNDNDNIMYFANDDDFAAFCIDPEIKVKTIVDCDGNNILVSDYDFSNNYHNAVNSGVKFCIQDINSHVNKDGLLGYRSCTKKIDNIEKYYGD